MAKRFQIKEENYEKERGPPVLLEAFNKVSDIAKKAVCKIIISNNESNGSGFLAWFSMSNSIKKVMCGIFTNKHVIKNPQDVHKENIIFLFEGNDELEAIHLTKEMIGFTWSSEDRLNKDEELDVSFIEISIEQVLKWQSKGARFLEIDKFQVGERIIVVQHPEGKKMAIDNGQINGVEGNVFMHSAGTYGGSSGSPILNLQGSVAGLHRGHKVLSEKPPRTINIGVNLKMIVSKLIEVYAKQGEENVIKGNLTHDFLNI